MTHQYLLNSWYLAAWSDEVSASKPLARTLLDRPVVFFRDGAGKPAALADRCPHRIVPLSMGTVEAGILRCGYHGLGFDGAGKCTVNPHGPITSAAKVGTYPLHEAYGAIWIWMGDPELSDVDAVPDLSTLTAVPSTAASKGYLHSRGGYVLFCDNILDLSHADYLHADTLGGGALSRTRARIEKRLNGLTATWIALADQAQPMMDLFLPEQGKPADIVVTVDWTAPGMMRLINRITPSGGAADQAIEVDNFHIVTPETATTTHYFFASTRNFGQHDAALNDKIAQTRLRVFSTEDNPMIEAQQALLGGDDLLGMQPLLLPIDSGMVQARRILGALIRAEGEAGQPPFRLAETA